MSVNDRGPSFTSPCKGEVARVAGGGGSSVSRFARQPDMTQQARRLRKEPSEAEKKLWRLLRQHQIERLGFRRSIPSARMCWTSTVPHFA